VDRATFLILSRNDLTALIEAQAQQIVTCNCLPPFAKIP
jgi:hypothetical protein